LNVRYDKFDTEIFTIATNFVLLILH